MYLEDITGCDNAATTIKKWVAKLDICRGDPIKSGRKWQATHARDKPSIFIILFKAGSTLARLPRSLSRKVK